MRRRSSLLSSIAVPLIIAGAVSLSACQSRTSEPTEISQDTAITQTESERLNDWFEARFQDELALSPMTQTYFGQKTNQDKLDDASKTAYDALMDTKRGWLATLRNDFDYEALDRQSRLSYRLFEYSVKNELATHAVSDNDYVFQHMSGPHSSLPSFMINFHAVNTPEDAQAYIARLSAFDTYLGQYMDNAKDQYSKGVTLPRFVYDKLSDASQNVITGAPFTEGEDSPLFSDIKSKINGLDIEATQKETMIEEARRALIENVHPVYQSMLEMFADHKANTTDDDGAWKLPNATDYYQTRLTHYTTTDMTAEEIHEIGLVEVARIQDEMRQIMADVEFEGNLQDFYQFLRTDPQFTYSNDDAGREAYITEATAIIDDMKGRLDSLFITKPKADMIVKRVEPFREATAFGAFYNQPALDGSRPGTYYINLKDVREQPIYLMQALAYHEGIPGHHMQIAIGLELEGLPKFRTLGGYTSYTEGWALYSESLGKDIGLYTDPYSDFGRLSMEIFRAARLVVDTGIHAKKWTREQAVQYYLDNIPNPEGDVRAEIDRYIVWPGQATAYKIGMLKIQELRKNAEDQLGDKFDIREFHDVVLANGAVPLTILEELVTEWVTSKQ